MQLNLIVRSCPILLLIFGSLLRILYTWSTDPRIVHDDHFEVMRIMLNEGRLPAPAERWQSYQPPLYHALGAVVYHAVAGDVAPDEQVLANPRHAAGRKAVQFVSTLAGIATLGLVLLTLRLLLPGRPAAHVAGIAFAAFLPEHVYMCAMTTNDSLAYLWASACLYAVLRGAFSVQRSAFNHGWPTSSEEGDAKTEGGNAPFATRTSYIVHRTSPWWFVAAVAAALAMWTKQYGLGSLVILATGALLALILGQEAERRAALRGGILAVALALALGAWPYLRMWRTTGNPLASNFTLRPHTMHDQWPGRLSDVSFASFRPDKLLVRPWQHLDTVSSFWTQLYAKLWFDHDTTMTLYQYRPWFDAMLPIRRDRSIDGRERERRQLLWGFESVSRPLLLQGRLLLALGLLPTLMIGLGMVTGLWDMVTGLWCPDVHRDPACIVQPRSRCAPGHPNEISAADSYPVERRFVLGVLLTSLLMGLAAPLFQTIRQPFLSSMKAAFLLPALSAMAVFLAAVYAGYLGLPSPDVSAFRPWFRRLLAVNLAALVVVVTWHFVYLSWFWPQCADYFPRVVPKW